MLDVYHQVPHSLNVELSKNDLELDLLVVKPEYMLFRNNLRDEDLWSLSLFGFLNDLEPRWVHSDLLCNHSRALVGIGYGLLKWRGLVLDLRNRGNWGIKPLIALHHTALPLIGLALFHNKQFSTFWHQNICLLLALLIEQLRLRQKVVLVPARLKIYLYGRLLPLIFKCKGEGRM